MDPRNRLDRAFVPIDPTPAPTAHPLGTAEKTVMSKRPSRSSHHAMHQQTLEELEELALSFDEAVEASPDIDRFCSSTRWILPAASALMPEREPWIFHGPSGWVAMMRGRHPEGWHYLEPFEASWGLACPLVGPDPEALAADFVHLCHRRRLDWNVLLLMGLPEDSELFRRVSKHLHPYYDLFRGQVTTRNVASLAGGLDGFLSRRSRNFRRALRRAEQKADDTGIEFLACEADDADSALELYERIVAIEQRSWKGQGGVGIDAGAMHRFYEAMIQILAMRGELRTVIARHEDRDIAYVLGGICGTQYRGLQFSFDHEFREYSLGNLCQYVQIIDLVEEGIETYDLGTDMDYKRRWAELRHDTTALIVYKRSVI